VTIDDKTFYLRPEKIKLSNNSKFEGIVEKSLFAGKEYKISVNVNDDRWIFFNDFPVEKNKKIKLEFENKDLLEFDSTCSNFFTSN
jgi:ABC-type Fe3+/spermidine/putrescine transport system ATPase subunit